MPGRCYPVPTVGPASLYFDTHHEAGTDVHWRAGATPLGLFLLLSPGSRVDGGCRYDVAAAARGPGFHHHQPGPFYVGKPPDDVWRR